MYIRFVTGAKIDGSRHRLGVICAADGCMAEDLIAADHREAVRAAFDYINSTLPYPRSYARARRSAATDTALSWFKPTAYGLIRRVRTIVFILESAGVYCETLTTDRPGFVVHEDEYQVVAVPFRDDTF